MLNERARTPGGRHWHRVLLPWRMRPPGVLDAAGWQRGQVHALSALEMAELPDQSGIGPQWHISISRGGRRATNNIVQRVLRDFGLRGAEEDNHHPGVARHFWRPLDIAKRVSCECKESEEIIVEPDGYTWTNPREARLIRALCRGCEYERRHGRPCGIHARGIATRHP